MIAASFGAPSSSWMSVSCQPRPVPLDLMGDLGDRLGDQRRIDQHVESRDKLARRVALQHALCDKIWNLATERRGRPKLLARPLPLRVTGTKTYSTLPV